MDKNCKYSKSCGHEYCNSTECADFEPKLKSAEALWYEYFGEIEDEDQRKKEEAEEKRREYLLKNF